MLSRLVIRKGLFAAVTLAALAPIRAEDSPAFVPGSWTLVVLPDTQRYTDPICDPGMQTFNTITQWIADNKDSRNIQFVLHEGDITGGNTAATWQVASEAMGILDTAGVPYSMTTGNHDHDQYNPDHQNSPSRDTLLNNYFPVSRYAAMPTYGGVFESGQTQNNYHLFSAGGKDYIAVALEWGPRNETIAWADSILTNYPDRTALILTHAYTYSDGSRYDWAVKGTAQDYNPHCDSYAFSSPHDGSENVNDGRQIWDKLVSKHANVSMVFSGHLAWAGAMQAARGDYGQVVYEMLAAYHDPYEGGPTTGYIRLLEFNPDGQTVQVKTYSPKLDAYLTDSGNQFVINQSEPEPPVHDIPDGSILVATRGWEEGSLGVAALDLNGSIVARLQPQGSYDVVDVQQIAPGGDILLGQHPFDANDVDRVSRYGSNGQFIGDVVGSTTGRYAAHLAIADPLDGSNLAFIEYNTGLVSSMDLTTNQIVSTLDLGVDAVPRGMDVGPNGFVYVALVGRGILKLPQDLSSYQLVVKRSADLLCRHHFWSRRQAVRQHLRQQSGCPLQCEHGHIGRSICRPIRFRLRNRSALGSDVPSHHGQSVGQQLPEKPDPGIQRRHGRLHRRVCRGRSSLVHQHGPRRINTRRRQWQWDRRCGRRLDPSRKLAVRTRCNMDHGRL